MAKSHVDDGHLHAYLDGALDAYPQAEAARVRRHLEECAACAARLDDARAVRRRVGDLLGATAVHPADDPPLEELRRRAAATSPRPTRSRSARLGWAASVVLALGTGWLLRGGVPPRTDPGVEPSAPVAADAGAAAISGAAVVTESVATGTESVPARAAPVVRDDAARVSAAPAVAPAESPAAPAGLRAQTGASVAASPPPARASSPEVAPVLGDLARALTLGEVVVTRSAASRDAPAITPPGLPEVALARLIPEAKTVAAADEPDPRSGPSREAFVLTSEERSAADAERSARESERARRAAERARSSALGSFVVPGLEVVSVDWVEIPGGQAAGVRYRQLLADGDTLEILHLPPGVAPSAAPGADGDRTRLEVEGAEGWLILRARASGEELAGLLERLLEG